MKSKQKIAEELISDVYSKILDGYFGRDNDFDDHSFREDLEDIANEVEEG